MNGLIWRRIMLTLIWVLVCGFGGALGTIASESLVQSEVNFNLPPRGAPGRRKGAGTRNECSQWKPEKERLTALVPPTNIGLTISEYPRFWFYVPYPPHNPEKPTEVLQVEFLLLDSDSKQVFRRRMLLENTPGVISVALPKNESLLESDRRYQWVFSVVCDPEDPTADDFVKGQVMRQDSLLERVESQLRDGEGGDKEVDLLRERAIVYAENGLWYDALTSLAELYGQNPENQRYSRDWVQLLKQVGLDEVVAQLIVDCCQSED